MREGGEGSGALPTPGWTSCWVRGKERTGNSSPGALVMLPTWEWSRAHGQTLPGAGVGWGQGWSSSSLKNKKAMPAGGGSGRAADLLSRDGWISSSLLL